MPEYLPDFRAEAGVVDDEVDLFLDFSFAELAMAAAIGGSVVVVLGFFFTGEFVGEVSFVSVSECSLSVRSLGLLMSWMI